MGSCVKTIPYIFNLTAYESRLHCILGKLTYQRRKPYHFKGPIRGFAIDIARACATPRWQRLDNFLPSWKPACIVQPSCPFQASVIFSTNTKSIYHLPTCCVLTSLRSGVYLEAFNFSIDSGATRLAIWPHARECIKNFNQTHLL